MRKLDFDQLTRGTSWGYKSIMASHSRSWTPLSDMLRLLQFARLSAAILTFSAFAHAQDGGGTNSSSLSFQVASGGNDNYFLRDNVTAAQLLLTSANNTSTIPRRFVVALPAGNTGALTYFLPLNATSNGSLLSVNLVNSTFHSTTREFNSSGVEADLAFSTNATLGVTIIGAVRAMRGMCAAFI